MEKARKRNTVWFRDSDKDDWTQKDFDSISQAKKFNGLNSRTVEKVPDNPRDDGD